MGTVSRQKVFLTSENHSEGKWLEPDLGNDLWNAALFPDLKVTQSSDDALPLFQNSDDVKNSWEDTPARQKSNRLPIFHELTRRGLSDEVPDESCPSTSSSSSGSSKGWEGFCDDSSFSKVESRLAVEFSNSLEIGRPKETPKPKDKKPRQMDIFRKKELTPKQWDHLRYTNEELCADVNFMEGVFVRLADVKQPPSTKERLIILKQLSRIVTPTNSLRLCVTTHSRRQVMLALEFILKERSLRQHVYAVLCKMFEDLDLLVELDMKELIFAGKAHVFHDTIAFCDMKQVITLANCLLKTSWAGIGSTLGMGLIGRLIGRANSLDFKSEPAWLEDCLPGLAFNVLQVKDLKAVFRILGIVSVRHLLENLSKDHEMFKGPEF